VVALVALWLLTAIPSSQERAKSIRVEFESCQRLFLYSDMDVFSTSTIDSVSFMEPMFGEVSKIATRSLLVVVTDGGEILESAGGRYPYRVDVTLFGKVLLTLETEQGDITFTVEVDKNDKPVSLIRDGNIYELQEK